MVEDLLAARLQMALSLGFHIIFASIGIAMPFLMAASHWRWLRTGDARYQVLTKAWSKGVAIFFAVGAVSGTALSFELGLLWPGFMNFSGPIIGMPFAWEGTAFFVEAIALGLFLYGWGRMPAWAHWTSGIVAGLAGVASGFFVICANAWMNSPAGFETSSGVAVNIDPWRAMFNDAFFIQGLHMIVAAFSAVGFAVAGIHALLFLKSRYVIHLQAMKIALVFGAVASIAQPVIGDFAAKSVAHRQPLKLAAAEALFETQTRAPLLIGGLPDVDKEKTDYAIEIPGLLSFMAFFDFDAVVKGLRDFPRELWPPVLIVHLAFQAMVGTGLLLAGLGALGLFAIWRRPGWLNRRASLIALTICTPLGFLAIEAGWAVTEVGRQPWAIYGVMLTREALTPRPGVQYTFYIYAVLYGFLALVVTALLIRQIRSLHRHESIEAAAEPEGGRE